MKPKPPDKPTAGRPLKGVGRVKISFSIESDLLAAVDAAAADRSCSRSDAINATLQAAVSAKILRRAK